MEYADSKKSEWYTVYNIPKRSGGFRKIEAPNDNLKKDQHDILKLLLNMYAPSKYSYGGIKKRNITQAAEKHVKCKYKLKMDIHDYFGSTKGEAVEKALKRNKNMSSEVAEKICYTCTNAEGVLPQGAPTSTFLANISAERMINAIGHVCGNLGIIFTMYVDDMVFSCDDMDKLIKTAKIVRGILSRYGYRVKKEKTVFMRRKQEVLGLCAATGKFHTRLPKKKRYYLRGVIHFIEKRIDNKEPVDMKLWKKVQGQIAFANMAKDQWSGRFNAALLRLNTKLKENENVQS